MPQFPRGRTGMTLSLVVGGMKEFVYRSITVPGPCGGFAVIIIVTVVVVVGYVPVFPGVPANPKLPVSLLSVFVFTVAHPSRN